MQIRTYTGISLDGFMAHADPEGVTLLVYREEKGRKPPNER